MLCCGRKPDGPAAESGAKGRRASWTKVSGEADAREPVALGRSFLQAMSFVEQGGAGFGELALFRQGRGSVVSPLASSRGSVGWSSGLGSRFRFLGIRGFCQKDAMLVVEGKIAVAFAPRSPRRTSFGKYRRSVQPLGVIVRSDSRQGGQQAAGPCRMMGQKMRAFKFET